MFLEIHAGMLRTGRNCFTLISGGFDRTADNYLLAMAYWFGLVKLLPG